MRKTKIVSTIGPSTSSEKALIDLVTYGTNIIRLNFSHGSYEQYLKLIDMIKKVRERLNVPLAILLDTGGPEIRTGEVENHRVELVNGQKFVLTADDINGNNEKVSITYKNLAQDIHKGCKILLDDGLIQLKVDELDGRDIVCTVINGGILCDKKSVNIPGINLNLPSLTDKDVEDIKFGIKNGIDFVAASFVRRPSDVLEIRKILEENNGQHIDIISKIENQEGVDNIDDIIAVSDGIMIARGDLGVEIPIEEVPIVQKSIIRKCNVAGKPVITATQMLDSMIRNPRPTRAEASDVANAIYDGTDCIMLSGETAIGKYPIEAIKTMASIASRVENQIEYDRHLNNMDMPKKPTVTDAICHSTCTTAHDLGASAIITATKSGYTARMVSKHRPRAPIIATTINYHTYYKLSMVWGVQPFLAPTMDNTDDMIEQSVEIAKNTGLVKNGDLVVITAGVPSAMSGTTNLIKVHIVGDILVKGTGIGDKTAYGRVCIIQNSMQAREKFQEGDIIVAPSTNNNMMPYIKKAAALIVEQPGITSHAAVVGLALEIPVIVGAPEATETLYDGSIVTVDPFRGFVFNGKAKIL
ncbi:MAG TPA: pyruvate kinase [Clostridiales bacterium]|nr:pyruvate kinase [Clostridiales bacterium]